MSDSFVLFALAGLAAVVLALGIKKGFMPTYLTGGASRQEQPIGFWIAGGVLVLAFFTCLVGGFMSL